MNVPFNDLTRIHTPLKKDLDSAWNRVVSSNAYILGKEVEQFEDAFARYCGHPGAVHCAGISNGLNALTLILRALGIGVGDEVVTQANTFNASAAAIAHSGARPVLVDVDPVSGLMDISKIEKVITPHTKAIMPVHLYGQQTPMKELVMLSKKHNLFIVEDAAQAHGSFQDGFPPSTYGIAAGFSMYPGKNLGAFGDAGAVVSHDKELIEKIKKLRNYGQKIKYHHDETGYNERLDGLQAAILNVKLPYLDSWNASRSESAHKLIEGLKDLKELHLPTTVPHNTHTYHLFVIRTNNRDALAEHLKKNGIDSGIHYPVPIHLQPAFSCLGYHQGDFPVSEEWCQTTLSLPVFPFMKQDEIDAIIAGVKSFYTSS